MINNPEFRKNTWLEISPHRLIIGFVLLILIFAYSFITGTSDRDIYGSYDSLFTAALVVGIILCALWGTKQAADSIIDEIREKTWPFIKLSSISPLKLMLGKIFGANCYVWILTLACIITGYIVFPSGETQRYNYSTANDYRHLDKNFFFIYCILLGLTCHVTAYLMALKSISGTKQNHNKAGSVMITILIIMFAGSLFMEVENINRYYDHTSYYYLHNNKNRWYGIDCNTFEFIIFRLSLILCWMLVGAYNLTRAELGYKISNLPWALFLLFVAFFAYGHVIDIDYPNNDHFIDITHYSIFPIALGIWLSFYYLLILLEKKDIVLLRKLRALMKNRDISGLNSEFPLWYITLGFVLVALVASMIVLPNHILFLLSVFLLMIRDTSIIFYFAASNKRRSDITAIIYIVILYSIVPLLVGAISGHDQKMLFYPDEKENIGSAISLLLQSALALVVTINRIKPLLAAKPKL